MTLFALITFPDHFLQFADAETDLLHRPGLLSFPM